MNDLSWVGQLRDFFWSDPLLGVTLAAAVIAFATTPIAFAVLGRLNWFQARRGRTLQRPSFVSIVCSMLLVMGIPAMYCALVIKSRHFDKNRYEFDPNQTFTVIDQGRAYHDREEIEKAIKAEMGRLASERKALVEGLKKLDEAMLALRAGAPQSPAVAQALPSVFQKLAVLHKAVGLDAPQQIQDETAPPVELRALTGASAPAQPLVASAPSPAPSPALAAPVAPGSLSPAQVQAEVGSVPEPQRALAAMLPLANVPAGWEVGSGMGASSKARLETFNAENLYEKIDGRAESFIQYDVKGMAYTFYHPLGDDSGEVQLYVFEMGSPLKALGKYGSEKSDDVAPAAVGTEGYTSAGSLFFYSGRFYTQIVSNKDDPKYAACALELAKRVASAIAPAPATAPVPAGAKPAQAPATPEAIFALLPAGQGRASPKYVAQDVFGFSFMSDVFLADYQDGGVAWQGFLRPYPTADAAREIFEKYVASARQDGAEIKMIEADGADRMFRSASFGQVDVVFLKGNAVGGANGANGGDDAGKHAEAFARKFAASLPATVPVIEDTKSAPARGGEGTGEN